MYNSTLVPFLYDLKTMQTSTFVLPLPLLLELDHMLLVDLGLD